MIIELKGFGSARKLTGMQVELSDDANVTQLRQILMAKLKNENDGSLITILQTCAFANQRKVFNENEPLTNSSLINVLPPVCGG